MDEQATLIADRTTELKNEMLFVLSNRDSGTLAAVVTGSERQTKELQIFLKEHLKEYRFYHLDLTPHSYTSLDKALVELLPAEIKIAAPAEWVIHITGLENNIYRNEDGRIEYSALLPQLNFEREQLFRQSQILVLWMSKSFYAELRSKAPDLMHWLSNRFVFDGDGSSLETAEETYNKGELKQKGKTGERTERIIELEAAWEKLCIDHEDRERLIKDKINILVLLGKEYRQAFDFISSEAVLKRALALCEKIQSAEAGNVCFEIGSTYLKSYKLKEALLYYQKSLQFDETAQNENFLGANYHQIGMVYEAQRKWQEALDNYSKAIEWNTKTGNEFKLDGTYHQIGMVYEEQRKWQEALDNYSKAIEWNTKTGNEFELGGTYHQIGMVYEKQQKWQEALNSYNKAVEWNMKTGNEFQLGNTYHQIGMVYEKQRQWQEALNNFIKAVEWKIKTGNEFELGGTYHQIGMVYEGQRKWQEALDNYSIAIKWNTKTGNEFQLGGTYHQIGRVYEEQRKWQEALDSYSMAIEWKTKTENEFELGSTYHQIGRVYEEQEDLQQAERYFILAKQNLEKFDHPGLPVANASIERIGQAAVLKI